MNVVSFDDSNDVFRQAKDGGLLVLAYMVPLTVHFSDGRVGSRGIFQGMYVEGPQEKADRENFHRRVRR